MGMRRDGQGWLLYGEIRGIREGLEVPKRGLEAILFSPGSLSYQSFAN